ncbi:hypothetical protein BU24DRAFT_474229 [Aaosphaeria arxii CBS 175.79]|uniref:Uncharacterized protein n=1 Tax=Aaosphaeria arxii CBS 175.79 TaxID=1450172 RepID=A0A6A5X995_9PLEO|nr:uncharacterized protein BU24DRAFT_474229 [Aaosphaeria arxii CBS 175.79]KAF2009324.1 hypothetical protein BU24DRAFT_474229 [Aaosphaeria arxii CBS 175.79]
MSGDSVTFTSREMHLISCAWKCFDSEPKMDMQKLTELSGYSRNSTPVMLGNVKKKMKQNAASWPTTSGTPTATPKKATPGGRKRRHAEEDASDDTEGSPTKKSKAGRKPKASTRESNNDGEIPPLKIKKEKLSEFCNSFDDNQGQTGFNPYENTFY